jgi:hypothetical protein
VAFGIERNRSATERGGAVGLAAAVLEALFIRDWRAEPLTSPDNVDEVVGYWTYGYRLFSEPVLDGGGDWTPIKTATTALGHIEAVSDLAD